MCAWFNKMPCYCEQAHVKQAPIMNERVAVATERIIFWHVPHPAAFYTLSTHRKLLRRAATELCECFNRAHLHAPLSHTSDLKISSE